MPRKLAKHYSWVCLWKYFWKKLVFESINWEEGYLRQKQLGIIQSFEDLTEEKCKRKVNLLSVWSGTSIFSSPHICHTLSQASIPSPWNLTFWIKLFLTIENVFVVAYGLLIIAHSVCSISFLSNYMLEHLAAPALYWILAKSKRST